ncbi:hypothetical protein ACNJKD_00110 [Edwardsiella tarda]|uniref:hypothetical protein n=1 Tax=Edwardsiella tarda TaxID=636 RepID=UPI003A843E44
MSNGFSLLERSFSRFLSNFPHAKKIIKKCYVAVNYFLHRKSYEFKSDYTIKSIDIDEMETFFGYYDKCPDNGSGDVIVYASPMSTRQVPDPLIPIKLYVYNIYSDSKKFISDISSYNWQQGSRAHWLSDDLLIYNCFSDEKSDYVSRVYSLKEERVISEYAFAVQDSYQSEYFLSINYTRLMALRPDYGYRNKDKISTTELSNLSNDGIWSVDVKSGLGKLILTINDIVNFKFENHKDYQHKINHVMISPDGEKFIFIHRYYINNKRVDRLLLSSKNGELISVLADNKMVSHCYWSCNDKIIGYLRSKDGVDSYWEININDNSSYHLLDGALRGYGDGHPSINNGFLITDTYPNKSRYQKLLLIDINNNSYVEIGEFFHGLSFSNESRCDLHPRFSHDGCMIFFDTVFSGKRKLCYLLLKDKSCGYV